MTTITRGIIKSYTPGTHRASVQLAGSLSVWLDELPVATDIPAAECIAERECTVVFYTDDNPADAVVATIHGAVPAAGGGGGDEIIDADSDTYVRTEEAADEDILRFRTAGTERMYIDATGRLTLINPWGHAFGSASPVNTIAFQYGVSDSPANSRSIWTINPVLTPSVTNLTFRAVEGNMIVAVNGVNAANVNGLSYGVLVIPTDSGRTVTEMAAVIGTMGTWDLTGDTLTVTDIACFKAGSNFGGGEGHTWTRAQSFWSNWTGNAAAADAIGLRITDITAGDRMILIWAGPNTPSVTGVTNLRLDAGTPTNAGSASQGDSKLYLGFNENGTVAMRQVRHKTFATLAAGDKVLIGL